MAKVWILLVLVAAAAGRASSHPLQQLVANKLEYIGVKSPAQDAQCAKGHTHCSTGAETFGCCPTEDAVCCDNGKYCCPKDHVCDAVTKLCTKVANFLYIHQNSSHNQSPVLADNLTPQTVTCKDGVSVCPADYTCCKFKDHQGYGCCKGSGMVCCEDDLHCCPKDTTCDVKQGNCKGKIKALSVSFPVMPTSPPPRSILCPDGSTACPNGDTCCPLVVNGTYGCCPKPDAHCCADKTHCCPHEYFCAPDTCSHKDLSLPVIAKLPLVPHANLKTVCSDGSTSCGVNDTCCMHPDKSWGCCPTHNAVCCSDGHHCCPEKHTCDMIDFTCKPEALATTKVQNHQLPWLKDYPGGKYNEGSTDHKDAL